MQLLTEKLPSGYKYNFISLNIKPMNFAQILEYMENVPSDEVEKLYFDYKTVLQDDSNVDNLLLCDLDYVIFLKKCLTISKDEEFDTSVKCPVCGSELKTRISLKKIEFNKLDSGLMDGMTIGIGGNYHDIMMPTVSEFMKIFANYRKYKKITDLKIIKLVALFTEVSVYQQKIENIVINSTYEDISMLTMLSKLYYDVVKPYRVDCMTCKGEFEKKKNKLISELDPEKDKDKINSIYETNYGGIAVGIESLIVNFFRDVIDNNKLADNKVLFRKIRKTEKS
jgi:transcription elongation factor Elf1